MSHEYTPAVLSRSQTVSRITLALIWITILELLLIGVLILKSNTIPGELWASFSTFGGALIALLINTKIETPPAAADPVPVEVVQDTPLAVDQVEEAVEDAPKVRRRGPRDL